MFAFKNRYYIYLDNTKTLNLNLIKKRDKFTIIYRNFSKKEEFKKVNEFRKKCKIKKIDFFVANNIKLANYCKADGLYISSTRRGKIKHNYKKIIGSAHNFREIFEKKKQGCKKIILSRLFKTNYKNKKSFMGLARFNLLTHFSDVPFVALGGIRYRNLNYLKIVNTDAFAILSEVKKKPAIISRLF